MYSDIYNPNQNEVFQYRLEQARQNISNLKLSTKEEYQAEVVSQLNQLMTLRGQAMPLRQIVAETPALIGDIQENLDILNGDVRAVSAQLLATEQNAAGLLNLYAATQSSLRRRLRQMLFLPTGAQMVQHFVAGDLMDESTCEVDLNAGVATLPVAKQTTPVPDRIRVGVSSDGALLESSSIGSLLDGRPHTVLEWSGSKLELVFEFSTPVTLNRIAIEPHDYEGVAIEEMSCSPDGIYHENILDELPADFRKIDAESNKFSGQYVADFTPKETRFFKLVLRDYAGVKRIRLRGISFFSRSFQASGYIRFKPVRLQAGRYRMETIDLVTATLTSIQHQISTDGAKFRVIQPHEEVEAGGPFWYRVFFERNEGKFESDQNPYLTGVQDPDASSSFTSSQPAMTTDLGGGIYLREIPLDTVTAALRVKDLVVAGSMEVEVGGQKLGSEGFTFNQNILYLKSLPASAVVLRYQTSLAGQSSFSLRKAFFSPYLYGSTFRRVL
jgi:hypothetical protein